MIQDSINQMLGLTAMIGGYAGHVRSENINRNLDTVGDIAKKNLKEAGEKGDQDQIIAAKHFTNHYTDKILGNKVFAPIQSLSHAKDISKEVGLGQLSAFKAMKKAREAAEAKQEQANNNFMTNLGPANQLPPQVQTFVKGQIDNQDKENKK